MGKADFFIRFFLASFLFLAHAPLFAQPANMEEWSSAAMETSARAERLLDLPFGAGNADAQFLYQNALNAYMEAIATGENFRPGFWDGLVLSAIDLAQIRRKEGVAAAKQALAFAPSTTALMSQPDYLRARARLMLFLIAQKESFKPKALEILNISLGKLVESRTEQGALDIALIALKINWDGKLAGNLRQREENYKAVDALMVLLRRLAVGESGRRKIDPDQLYAAILMDRADGESKEEARDRWLGFARATLDSSRRGGEISNIQDARLAALSKNPSAFVSALIDESLRLRLDAEALLNAIDWTLSRDDTAVAILDFPEADAFVLLENAMWEESAARRKAILDQAAGRLSAAAPSGSLSLVRARLAMLTNDDALLADAMAELRSQNQMESARIYALRARPGDAPHGFLALWNDVMERE